MKNTFNIGLNIDTQKSTANTGESHMQDSQVAYINKYITEAINVDNCSSLMSMLANGFNILSYKYKDTDGLDACIKCRLECDSDNLGDTLTYLLSTPLNKHLSCEGVIDLLKFNNLSGVYLQAVYNTLKNLSPNEYEKLKRYVFTDINDSFYNLNTVDIFKAFKYTEAKVNLKNIHMIKELSPIVWVSNLVHISVKKHLRMHQISTVEIIGLKEKDSYIIRRLGSGFGVKIKDINSAIELFSSNNGLKNIAQMDEDALQNAVLNVQDKLGIWDFLGAGRKNTNLLNDNSTETKDAEDRQIESNTSSRNKASFKSCDNIGTDINKVLTINTLDREDDTNMTIESKKYDMIGESNYKVSAINACISLENASTCETKMVTLQADNIDDLNNKIELEISNLNKQNDKKLADSLIEMMNTDSDFRASLLKLMKDAQIKK